jgi:Rieske Fe-S protein
MPTNPEKRGLNRRVIIRGGVAGTVALTTFPACGGDGTVVEPPDGPIQAGNVSAVAVGSLRRVSSVILGRDAGGLYAMSAACTHMGCAVTVSGTALSCPCHGSAFDANGAVTRGPAGSPLRHYAVMLAADGSITIDATMPVAANVRTAVA